ncbi:MAG: CemA family protein [Cyanobacteria bacterium J06592_8]
MNPNSMNFNRFSQWLNRRQLQLLDEAYQAAQDIRALEDKYFQGGKITPSHQQSKTIYDYVKSLRDRKLLKIRSNLAQFQLGGFFLNRQISTSETLELNSSEISKPEAEIITKLDYIESVIGKYRDSDDELERLMAEAMPPSNSLKKPIDPLSIESDEAQVKPINSSITPASTSRLDNRSDLFRGRFFGFRKELDPEYEQQVIQELRFRQKQGKIAIRWLVILLLIPVLVQVVFKNIVFEPVLGSYTEQSPSQLELNQEIQENLLREFSEYKEKLEVEELLGVISPLSFEQRQERLKEDAVDLWREGREEQLDGLKNLLADGVALLAFVGLVYFNRAKLTIIRNFSNQTFLSLTDPTKVFLFILITDIFVGFHSAEGWEVLLVGITEHFGLPENKAAINTFIATVPVFMDSCVKFWIFSYLTRYSPSTSAIYERMNT